MSNTLETIQELGSILKNKKQEAKTLELQLSNKNQEIRHLEEVQLPQIMDELGIEAIDLRNGGRIEAKDFIHTRISEKNQEEAFQWLRDTQNDGIIKNEITIKLGKGSDEQVKSIIAELQEENVPFDYKKSVHPGTLKSFVTEVLNNQELRDQLPREAFSVYEGRKVVFK